MARDGNRVLGVEASPPRPTFRGRLWLSVILSVPAFLGLSALELLWRWVF